MDLCHLETQNTEVESGSSPDVGGDLEFLRLLNYALSFYCPSHPANDILLRELKDEESPKLLSKKKELTAVETMFQYFYPFLLARFSLFKNITEMLRVKVILL